MKTAKRILIPTFSVGYGVFLSLFMECLLHLFGLALAISPDGRETLGAYPRFVPFCLAVGLFSVAAVVILFVFHVKASERLDFTKRTWCFQLITAFVLSIPMIKPWEILFAFLEKTL